MTLPHPNCYVVGDARLFAGEYPFAKSESQGLEKLSGILAGGVTAFVDLTTSEDGMTEYEHHLAGVAQYHHHPIPDNGVPNRYEMDRVLDRIDSLLESGESVYVHCWGGIGRTGTVIGCYLVRHGLTGDEALREVSRMFNTLPPARTKRHPEGSPQTSEQRKFVQTWKDLDPIPQRVPGVVGKRAEQAERMAIEAILEHGTAARAIVALNAARDRLIAEEGIMAAYGGSMGGLAAEEESMNLLELWARR